MDVAPVEALRLLRVVDSQDSSDQIFDKVAAGLALFEVVATLRTLLPVAVDLLLNLAVKELPFLRVKRSHVLFPMGYGAKHLAASGLTASDDASDEQGHFQLLPVFQQLRGPLT